MASEYVCDFGYGIRGNTSVRTCVAEGTGIYGDWNGTAPTCEGTYTVPMVGPSSTEPEHDS